MHLVREAGLEDKIEADSAGTGAWHVGQPAHWGTLAILKQKAIAYQGQARQLKRSDLDDFDYIITMDDEHFHAVRRHGQGRAKVAPLLEYARHAKSHGIYEVPDPYFDGGFDLVYLLVRDGAEGLLDAIRQEHGL